MVWKLGRLGRDLRHLVSVMEELTAREISLRLLTGQGAQIDTTAAGRLVFAALSEFERELIRELTLPGSRPPAPGDDGADGSSASPKRRFASSRPP